MNRITQIIRQGLARWPVLAVAIASGICAVVAYFWRLDRKVYVMEANYAAHCVAADERQRSIDSSLGRIDLRVLELDRKVSRICGKLGIGDEHTAQAVRKTGLELLRDID